MSWVAAIPHQCIKSRRGGQGYLKLSECKMLYRRGGLGERKCWVENGRRLWKLDNLLSWLTAWEAGIPDSCRGRESYLSMCGYSRKKMQTAAENNAYTMLT